MTELTLEMLRTELQALRTELRAELAPIKEALSAEPDVVARDQRSVSPKEIQVLHDAINRVEGDLIRRIITLEQLFERRIITLERLLKEHIK